MRDKALLGEAVTLAMMHLRESMTQWGHFQFDKAWDEARAANHALLVAIDNAATPAECRAVAALLTKAVDIQDNCETITGGGDMYDMESGFSLAKAFAKALQTRVVLFKGVGEAGWRVSLSLPPAVEDYFFVEETDADLDDVHNWPD